MLLNKISFHPQFLLKKPKWKNTDEEWFEVVPYHQKKWRLTLHVLKLSLWALLVRCTTVLLRNRIIFAEKHIILPSSAQIRRKKKCNFLQHAVWRCRLATMDNFKLIKGKQKQHRAKIRTFTKKWSFQHFFCKVFHKTHLYPQKLI